MRSHVFAAASLLAAACLGPEGEPGVSLPVQLPAATADGNANRPSPPPVRRGAEVTGGTITTVGEDLVAVSDADADRLHLVKVFGQQNPYPLYSVPLPERSHPGRSVVGDDQVLFLTLRGTGEVARIDTKLGTLIGLTFACAEPRGIVWDASAHAARVACGNGVVATVDTEGRVLTERWPGDLRDLLIRSDGALQGVTFRTGDIVKRDGAVVRQLPSLSVVTDRDTRATFVPNVAWRTFAAPDGSLVSVHQRSIAGPVASIFSLPITTTTTTTTTSAYGGTTTTTNTTTTTTTPGCTTPVIRSAVSVVRAGGELVSTELPGVLPVDAAVSNDGELTVAFAGSRGIVRKPLSSVDGVTGSQCTNNDPTTPVGGIPSGVTYLPDGTLVVHTVAPARVLVLSKSRGPQTVVLSAPLPGGMPLFYTGVHGVACASCHPEGRDDGHVWDVKDLQRKTPSLVGGILETAPFHWEGEHATLSNVMADTFVQRMGGDMPLEMDIKDMATWLNYLPRAAPLMRGTSKDQVAHGRQVFEGAAANCIACHTGPHLTDNLTRDVGTGGKFQTPSLIGVASHGPWLHDGRAATLRERFLSTGGGDKHGGVSQLSTEEVDALVAYLETL